MKTLPLPSLGFTTWVVVTRKPLTHLGPGQLLVAQRNPSLARNNFLPDPEGLLGKGLASAKLDYVIDPHMTRAPGSQLNPMTLSSCLLGPSLFPLHCG